MSIVQGERELRLSCWLSIELRQLSHRQSSRLENWPDWVMSSLAGWETGLTLLDGRIHHFWYLLFGVLCAIQWVFLISVIVFFSSKISTWVFLISSISLLSFCFFADTRYHFRHVHNCFLKLLFYCLLEMIALKSLSDHANISATLVLALTVFFFVQINIFLVLHMKKGFLFETSTFWYYEILNLI